MDYTAIIGSLLFGGVAAVSGGEGGRLLVEKMDLVVNFCYGGLEVW